jgi:hypothetical protein
MLRFHRASIGATSGPVISGCMDLRDADHKKVDTESFSLDARFDTEETRSHLSTFNFKFQRRKKNGIV